MAYVPEEKFSKLSRVASTFAREALSRLSNPIEATNNLQGVYNQVQTLIGVISLCYKQTYDKIKSSLTLADSYDSSLIRWGGKVDILINKLSVARAEEILAYKVLTTACWPCQSKAFTYPSSLMSRYYQTKGQHPRFLDRKLPEIVKYQKIYEDTLKYKLLLESVDLKGAKLNIYYGYLSLKTSFSKASIMINPPPLLPPSSKSHTVNKNTSKMYWSIQRLEYKIYNSIVGAVENRISVYSYKLGRTNSSVDQKLIQSSYQNAQLLSRLCGDQYSLNLNKIIDNTYKMYKAQVFLRYSEAKYPDPMLTEFQIDYIKVKDNGDSFEFQVSDCTVFFHLDNFYLIDRCKTSYRLPMLEISNNIPTGSQLPIHFSKYFLKTYSYFVKYLNNIVEKLRLPGIESKIFIKINDSYAFCYDPKIGRRYARKTRQLREERVYGVIVIWNSYSVFRQYDPKTKYFTEPFEIFPKGGMGRIRQIQLIKTMKNAYDEVKINCPFFKDRLTDIKMSDSYIYNRPSVTFYFDPAKIDSQKYRIDFMGEMTHCRHIVMTIEKNGELKKDILKWIEMGPDDPIDIDKICHRIMKSLVYIRDAELSHFVSDKNLGTGYMIVVKVFSK